jgi:hypothetical protein
MAPTSARAALAAVVCLSFIAPRALAWGDEGHEIVARIADHYLEPGVRTKVQSLLSGDRTRLTRDKGIAAEATWADKFRDSDRGTKKPVHYNATRNWHYVDLEIGATPDLVSACFGQPALPDGTLASNGPASDCIVDKINEFSAELRKARLSTKERRLALQFLLHFVGDVHQPLHASDARDQGGNEKTVVGPGLTSASLHATWDTDFVSRLGSDATTVATHLISRITSAERAHWANGTPADWAQESYEAARDHAYGKLPPPTSPSHYTLTGAYEDDATAVCATQLSKAGIRLAHVLNEGLK